MTSDTDARERIEADLRDAVIQSIYAVTLSLEDVPRLIETDRATAVERVDRAIDALHATMRELAGGWVANCASNPGLTRDRPSSLPSRTRRRP